MLFPGEGQEEVGNRLSQPLKGSDRNKNETGTWKEAARFQWVFKHKAKNKGHV